MLYLLHDTVNRLVFTATEMSTIPEAFWLIEFTHQQSGAVVSVTGPDLTNAVFRYNQLDVVVGAGDWLAGHADLLDGQHSYRVLQCAYFGVRDSPEVVCETGWAYVEPRTSDSPAFSTAPTEIPSWNG